jgi:hypothetical protein
MADYLYKPQNVVQVDDRGGNAFTIFTINHVQLAGGSDINIELDGSVVSAKHLEEAGQTVVTITVDADPANIPASGQRQGWSKTVSFPSESATGTYTIVCRHAGSAASIGSSNLDY